MFYQELKEEPLTDAEEEFRGHPLDCISLLFNVLCKELGLKKTNFIRIYSIAANRTGIVISERNGVGGGTAVPGI